MSSLDLNNTFGALLLGTIISSILYGFTCVQTWHYFQNYSDGPLVKVSVATLWILESLHSALSIHAIYYYVILNYLNPAALLRVTWSAATVLFVTAIIKAIVYVFYIWRIYILSRRNKPLVIVMTILQAIGLGAGVAVTVMALQLKFFASFLTVRRLVVLEDINLALAMVVDILIAGSLSIYLHISRSGRPSTDKIINRLVVYAINNGILICLAEVLCLAMATKHRSNLIYLAIYQCIGNLYTNSMLATLNARLHLANASGTSAELSDLSASFQIAKPTATATATRTLTLNGHQSINERSRGTESKDAGIDVNKSRITEVE